MILLDSDIILIDMRYKNDPKFAANQAFLQELDKRALFRGMTSQAFLEVIGILSFNVSTSQLARLSALLISQYGLAIFPDIHQHPGYAGCSVTEVLDQMRHKMALGDAVQAVQIGRFASTADCLLSWNARHFLGKIALPVFTPEEWLAQQTTTP